jgi:hypothetical protein
LRFHQRTAAFSPIAFISGHSYLPGVDLILFWNRHQLDGDKKEYAMKKIQLEPTLKNQSNDAYHKPVLGVRPAAFPLGLLPSNFQPKISTKR